MIVSRSSSGRRASCAMRSPGGSAAGFEAACPSIPRSITHRQAAEREHCTARHATAIRPAALLRSLARTVRDGTGGATRAARMCRLPHRKRRMDLQMSQMSLFLSQLHHRDDDEHNRCDPVEGERRNRD